MGFDKQNNLGAFVMGDSQYGYERPLALLKKEGFVFSEGDKDVRERKDISVVHVGDNGDYYWGTELRDQRAWEVLPQHLDEMLIGNHEAAAMFGHQLGGFSPPNKVTMQIMENLYITGKLKFATSHNGFLITHAGVHPMFEEMLPDDPVEAADCLNSYKLDPNNPILSFCGSYRGGCDRFGGILWRDVSEAISDKWPQIFGHSRMESVTVISKEFTDEDYHYAIDVGYPSNGRIAGIYTKDLKAVEVNING